jgi:hypothetical protein
MSRREAIATQIGCGIEDVTAYQAGRSKPQIYQDGDAYYVAVKPRETTPEPDFYGWKQMLPSLENQTGFKVYKGA